MTPFAWLLLFIALLAGAAIGWIAARRRGPDAATVDRLREELTAAHSEHEALRAEREQMRGAVEAHFEESASLFVRIAADYRAFYDHFADHAAKLGVGNTQAQQLLAQITPPTVRSDPEPETADAQEPPATAEEPGTNSPEDGIPVLEDGIDGASRDGASREHSGSR